MSEVDGSFESLLEHIRESRGFDFTGYKRESLTRRVRRRMQDIGVTSFEGYSDHLQVHPEEFKHLFDTVLINLTGFFRDPEAWQYLQEQIIPEIVEQRPNGPIRIWSAGCAGGQEAYTLAICFAEALGVDDLRQRVKIYATDVDDHALAQARAATYSRAQVAGLSEERLARWFEPVSAGNAFVVGKLLRRSVIFGRNDLVQDAPISRIDLLLNRNTLMYFNAETQGHVLQRLHFALNPGGFLFLGKAEMLLRHPDLFVPVEARRRLFRKVAHEPVAERQTFHGRRPAGRDAAPDALRQHVRHEAMMAAPTAQIAVDADGLLALCNRRAEALFGLGGRILGQPFQDLQLSYRPVELRAPMEQAHQDRRAVWLRGVEWLRSPTEVMVLDVQVLPLFGGDGARLGTTVMFHDVTRHHQLQAELQFANRQLEEAYQELQSSNEELETTNEELQSTNEELETINEELHSMNDELQTTNEDLRSASERLDELNHFLEAVLGSLESAVVVVDDELTVIAWNTAAAELWGVRTDEAVGRPLPQLDIGLPLDDVVPLLSTAVAAPDPGHSGLLAAGVNRRGRPVCVQVTVSPLRRPDQTPSGAILVMDVVPDSTG